MMNTLIILVTGSDSDYVQYYLNHFPDDAYSVFIDCAQTATVPSEWSASPLATSSGQLLCILEGPARCEVERFIASDRKIALNNRLLSILNSKIFLTDYEIFIAVHNFDYNVHNIIDPIEHYLIFPYSCANYRFMRIAHELGKSVEYINMRTVEECYAELVAWFHDLMPKGTASGSSSPQTSNQHKVQKDGLSISNYVRIIKHDLCNTFADIKIDFQSIENTGFTDSDWLVEKRNKTNYEAKLHKAQKLIYGVDENNAVIDSITSLDSICRLAGTLISDDLRSRTIDVIHALLPLPPY